MSKNGFLSYFDNKRKNPKRITDTPDMLPKDTAEIWKEITAGENGELFKTWLNLASIQGEMAMLKDLRDTLKKIKDPTPHEQTECIKKFYEKIIERKEPNVEAFNEVLLEKYGELKGLQKKHSDNEVRPFIYIDDHGKVKFKEDLLEEFHANGAELVKALKEVNHLLESNEDALKALGEGSNAVAHLVMDEATQRICFKKLDNEVMEIVDKHTDNKMTRM